MSICNSYDNSYHLKKLVPSPETICVLCAAINVTSTNIYEPYDLFPIAEYVEQNVKPKQNRVMKRIDTTKELMAALDYIKEKKIV